MNIYQSEWRSGSVRIPSIKIPSIKIPSIKRPSTIDNTGQKGSFGSCLSSVIKKQGAAQPSVDGLKAGRSANQLVSLGTITPKNSTVSKLIVNSSLKKECWNILYDKINVDKPFQKIEPGTKIYYNPRNREVLWGDAAEAVLVKEGSVRPQSTGFWGQGSISSRHDLQSHDLWTDAVAPGSRKTGRANRVTTAVGTEEIQNKYSGKKIAHQASGSNMTDQQSGIQKADTDLKLADAVRPFIGKDYDQMDCYELVVGGIRNLGIKYRGPGGLGSHLIKRASEKGAAVNHYLNGEGLVSESGRKIFKKTFFTIQNPENQAGTIMKDIQNVLQEGQILSFSTRSRGHTGVISRKDGVWTFINSGNMDHNLSGKNGHKGVGEELLNKEIQNWFELAKNRKEGLKITLGALDMKRLAMFRRGGVNEKV